MNLFFTGLLIKKKSSVVLLWNRLCDKVIKSLLWNSDEPKITKPSCRAMPQYGMQAQICYFNLQLSHLNTEGTLQGIQNSALHGELPHVLKKRWRKHLHRAYKKELFTLHTKKLLNMLQRIKELLKHWGQKRDHRKTEQKSSEWQGGRCSYQDTYFT